MKSKSSSLSENPLIGNEGSNRIRGTIGRVLEVSL